MQPDPKVSGQSGDAGELPTPTFSETQASPPSTDADDIVNRIIEKLEPRIDEIAERKVQSKRDKWIGKIQKTLGNRIDLLAELSESGVEIPENVRTQMEIRDLREQIAQPRTDQPAPVRDDGSSQQRAAVTEAIAELTKYQLDPNESGFIDTLRGTYKNRTEFDLAVNRYIVGKLRPQPTASPATVTQPAVTTRAAGEKTADQLQSDYNKERDALMTTTRPGEGRIRALSDLKLKYREQGLQV